MVRSAWGDRWRIANRERNVWDFPGRPVVRLHLPVQEVWV